MIYHQDQQIGISNSLITPIWSTNRHFYKLLLHGQRIQAFLTPVYMNMINERYTYQKEKRKKMVKWRRKWWRTQVLIRFQFYSPARSRSTLKAIIFFSESAGLYAASFPLEMEIEHTKVTRVISLQKRISRYQEFKIALIFNTTLSLDQFRRKNDK